MTTLQMEVALMKHFNFRQNIIVPNVSDFSTLIYTEADLLVLTKAGYATMVEIKVSKSDLLADKKKQWMKRVYNAEHPDNPLKGTLNEKFHKIYFKGIKEKYYAVPEEMKDFALQNIPDWCGLITVQERNIKVKQMYSIKVVRQATKLFPEKWDEKKIKHLMHLGCMRIYSLKNERIRSEKVNLI